MTSTQRAVTGLTSLPPELILKIIHLTDTDTPSQVSLACASRYIAECCHHLFLRRRAAYEKYGASSDLDPSTVPHLVRSALGLADPVDAWSVRSFEMWGARESWEEWRPFNLESQVPYTVQGVEPLRWSFLGGEAEAIVDVFRREMTGEEQGSAEKELREGGDGFLKTVLLALLSRLVDVKIVRGASEESLSWLASAMQWGRRRGEWEPGFASVRDVAVGVTSGTWRDRWWRDGMNGGFSPFTLVSILQLPQIRSLHFAGLDMPYHDEDDDDDEVEVVTRHTPIGALTRTCLPYKSLPLERLVLDCVLREEIPHGFREDLLGSPIALEAFSLRGQPDEAQCLDNISPFATAIAKQHGASFRRFMLYNIHNLNGYRCKALYPDELRPCVDLRQACVHASDVELCSLPSGGAPSEGLGPDDLYVTLEESFSDTLEVLVLAGKLGGYEECRGPYGESMDLAVARAIGEEGCLAGLKAVYLEQPETRGEPTQEGILFTETMRVGAERGIDVYTRTNRRERVHEIEFLAPVGKYDLMTGPYGRKGKEGLVLDVRTGEWEPIGCKACGRCDECLKVYVAELWDTIRSGTADMSM